MQLTANEAFFVPPQQRTLAETVFRALARARYARQAQMLAFAGPLGLRPELLDAWVDAGLIHRAGVRLAAISDRVEPYLALTSRGAHTLAVETGHIVGTVPASSLKRLSQKRAHDVVVGDIALAVLALERDHGIELVGVETDVRGLAVLHATVQRGRYAERIRLVPDAYVLTRGPRGPIGLLVEVDRGTVSTARMNEKYAAYLNWKREGGALRDLGISAVRILTTATTGAHEKRLHQAATEANTGRRSGLLLFTLEEHLSAAHPERMQERIALPAGSVNEERVPIFDPPTDVVHSRVTLPAPGAERQVVRPYEVAA